MDGARNRIVDAARKCFAAKGYAGTTIADIEFEAGYAPRTGGIYRHFPSKEAVLEAVIDAELEANEKAMDEPSDPEESSTRAVLERTVRAGLAQLDRQAELTRIVFHDLDQFPALLERFRNGVANATHRRLADALLAGQAAGAVPARLDAEAVAVIAVGSAVDFKIKQHLLGSTALNLSEERFIAAWADVFATVIGEPE